MFFYLKCFFGNSKSSNSQLMLSNSFQLSDLQPIATIPQVGISQTVPEVKKAAKSDKPGLCENIIMEFFSLKV